MTCSHPPDEDDDYLQSIKSLGKIGVGDETKISALVNSINSPTNESSYGIKDSYIFEVMELKVILTKPLMPKIVNSLKNNKKTGVVGLLWHCAQNLSYPEFYSAWHS